MYTNKFQSQVTHHTKSPINKDFSRHLLHTRFVREGQFSSSALRRFIQYVTFLPKSTVLVLYHMARHYDCEMFRITYRELCTLTGYTAKTVQRAIRTLESNGWITQNQKAPKSVCEYRFNREHFTYQQRRYVFYLFHDRRMGELLISEKTQIENVHQRDSINNIKNIFITKNPSLSPLRVEREGTHFKKRSKRTILRWSIKRMLSREQKQYIQDRKKQIGAREALLNPKINALIFTPFMEQIRNHFNFQEREYFKCIAFEESALRYAGNAVYPMIQNESITQERGQSIFFEKAVEYANANNQTVDWKWYFDVCEILGVEAFDYKQSEKEITQKKEKPSAQKERKGAYATWSGHEPRKTPASTLTPENQAKRFNEFYDLIKHKVTHDALT